MNQHQISLAGVPPIAHLDQYFGPWAVHEDHFTRMLSMISQMDLAAHVSKAMPLNADEKAAPSEKGVAVIPISGTMTKYGSSLSQAGSTILARRRIRQAVADPAVSSILLLIDSPGGTVAGTSDLADEVAQANAKKPVVAFIEDLGASAAYWVASQASTILANSTAGVGSIGMYGVVYDESKAAEKAGVRAIVVRAGEFKGVGVSGAEITDKQLAEMQRIINDLNQHFIDSIARGRRMEPSRAKALADGRLHIGKAAVQLGLIDQISTFHEAVDYARRQTPQGPTRATKEGSEMTTQSFTDSIQAALQGRLSAIPPDHVDLAVATIAVVREHDAGRRKAEIASAIERAKAAQSSAGVAIKHAATMREDERCARIAERGMGAGLPGHVVAEFIRSDDSLDDVLVAIDLIADNHARLNR